MEGGGRGRRRRRTTASGQQENRLPALIGSLHGEVHSVSLVLFSLSSGGTCDGSLIRINGPLPFIAALFSSQRLPHQGEGGSRGRGRGVKDAVRLIVPMMMIYIFSSVCRGRMKWKQTPFFSSKFPPCIEIPSVGSPQLLRRPTAPSTPSRHPPFFYYRFLRASQGVQLTAGSSD